MLWKIYNSVNNPSNRLSLNKPTCEKDWENILLQLGFSITNLGTMYLSYNLSKHKRYQTLTMKNIYKDVADKFDISSDNVKWLTEKSIKNMKKNVNSTKLYTILPNYDGREITAKYLFMLLLNAYNWCKKLIFFNSIIHNILFSIIHNLWFFSNT